MGGFGAGGFCKREEDYYRKMWNQWRTNRSSKTQAQWDQIYLNYKAWKKTSCGKASDV